ncbi:hypothetical protein CYLTODRAFT_417473 [Cylindrobasidium torrendii FP15055 ss-10]|uniref:Zn(2)-C6 fungal-type domain-containing protein n=1 Tax=Cylindrobasidium torrendii FP15055 ss-10 TaxID=1314674 RepID=A0A0D7BRU3_9AGAR|nr:hypothetical protein CYLTODRAFT_417473 [Cylindrobasidium torrendii FP15055 ss-10]
MSARAFRACLHCRSRKARCDLGNIDSPKDPPCARCRRERVKCEFAPSRRGGSRRKKPSIVTSKLSSPTDQPTASASSSPSDYTSDNIHPAIPAAPLRQPSQAASEGSSFSSSSKHLNGPAELAAQSLHNPEDAMNLLVFQAQPGADARISPHARPDLSKFPLVVEGILSHEQYPILVNLFFTKMHFFFPMVPFTRIPRTPEEMAKFAFEEQDLASVIVVIASRYMNEGEWAGLHEKTWAFFKTRLADLMSGEAATIGTVEALLLLSEYLPRIRSDDSTALHEQENRMAWNLTGMAVRIGYMMGLDQKTFITSSTPGSVTTEDNQLNRERLAWTYCYLFDRQISIRIGKAFWSRGPGLCFHAQNDNEPAAHTNFPSLKPVAGLQDDYASVVQAYTDLTQILTNAHDILYPSKDRTITLVKVGEYYKYLDAFTRSMNNGFQTNWQNKRWDTAPMADGVWMSFHYLRLYVSSFAFQAHVQRSMSNYSPENGYFAWDLISSPDAKFVLEGADAATEILKICTNRIHSTVGLSWLPWRFFLFFSHAAVYLLKALFIEAIPGADQRGILHLLKHLIVALSSDPQHPGARYARLLNGLMKTFCAGKDYWAESMTRAASPTPQTMDSSMGDATERQPSVSNGGVMPGGDVGGVDFNMDTIDMDWFDMTMSDPFTTPAEFSHILFSHEALDNDFWTSSVGMQQAMSGDWGM